MGGRVRFAHRSLRRALVTALLFSLFTLGMAAEPMAQTTDAAAEPMAQTTDAAAESLSQATDAAAEPAPQAIDAAAEPRPRVPGRPGSGPDTLPDAAQIVDEKGQRLRVTPLKGLERPWALAFLPDGAMLVTERPGRLRRVNADFTLDPQPIAGVPAVLASAYKGLMDVALHPAYADNRWVYLAYTKRLPGETDADWDQLYGPAGTAAVRAGGTTVRSDSAMSRMCSSPMPRTAARVRCVSPSARQQAVHEYRSAGLPAGGGRHQPRRQRP